ncbi:winged helix DNA-binding domain-containing protein [Actinoplanes sp. NPDC049316]|uniref:winged helix DNA-binding domain-containing protein n=1 Tax=Actinoplanes sp. NPDC049316 TaxID=3154727 RepID=UPI003434CBCE
MSPTVRHVTDRERRARLAVRHALAPAFRAGSPEAATRAVAVLHATEPATVYLSCWARTGAITPADVDRALYSDRSLVKQLAMRRTLFVFPRDLLPAVWPSASARVAATERARMTRDTVKAGLAADGFDWLDQARAGVLAALADAPEGRPAQEIRLAVPMIDVKVAATAGEVWSAHRVLTHLGATADIVRGTNTAGWHASRPRWTLMRHWLGYVPPHLGPADGYRELVRRWLASFGPGTEDDLTWWLGSTKTVVRAALAALDAVPVSLDHAATGWLLPGDIEEPPDPGPWAALLPVLDPTVMGWRGRDFYLGPYRDQIFDTRGNAGTTAWVDGRVVGCWVQDAAGVVRIRLLEDVPAAGRRLLEAEAERLTVWLGGFRVSSVYSSPAMKTAATP